MIWHIYLLEQRIREAFLRDAFPEYEQPELRRLARAVRSLPWLPRAVFHLIRFEGKSYEEIAEQLGISVRRVEIEFGRAIGLIMRSRNRQERKGW